MKVLRISGCFLFSILLLNRCTSSDQNTSKNVHSVDTVLIRQMQFVPAVLNVKLGDTVVWINKGMVDHNVTEEKNRSWTSDTIRIEKSWKMVVTDSVNYLCTIHPTMKGKLVLNK